MERTEGWLELPVPDTDCRSENKVSLGFVEGLNNKIRVIQRRCDGLRDEDYLHLKILGVVSWCRPVVRKKCAVAATQVYLPLATLPGSVAVLQPTRKHAV